MRAGYFISLTFLQNQFLMRQPLLHARRWKESSLTMRTVCGGAGKLPTIEPSRAHHTVTFLHLSAAHNAA